MLGETKNSFSEDAGVESRSIKRFKGDDNLLNERAGDNGSSRTVSGAFGDPERRVKLYRMSGEQQQQGKDGEEEKWVLVSTGHVALEEICVC